MALKKNVVKKVVEFLKLTLDRKKAKYDEKLKKLFFLSPLQKQIFPMVGSH